MIDCGFSAVEATKRVRRLGIEPADIDALLVTHEHGDHVNGVGVFSRRYDLPVYITAGTKAACRDDGFYRSFPIYPDSPMVIGDIHIHPFPVPHDARDPCQFVFTKDKAKLGLLTDVGSLTSHIVKMLDGCDALMLECNYDPTMLENGPYPQALCRRVGGDFGHLANAQAQSLLYRLDTSKLKRLVGMHLSAKNNLPELALRALQEGVGSREDWVSIACQEEGFGWCDVTTD